MTRSLIVAAGFILLAACASPPVNRDPGTPLNTVESVDLDQYLGLWFEIARLPNSFEENCEGVTAEYSRRDDGLIAVLNSCREGAPDGKLKEAKGRARVVNPVTNAELEVSFFGPFWGDYWIIDLAPDYSVAVVGEPSGRYLWILSRTPTLEQDVRTAILTRIEELGYDTSKLYFPAQPPVSYGAN